MKAKRLVFPRKLTCQVEEFEVSDAPGPDEVLVENRWGLISPGTELAMFTETHVGFPVADFTYAKYPFRPGYAAVGTALKVGANIKGVRPGDVVETSGLHASHAVVPARKCPAGLDARLAPFAKLAEISITAVFASDVRMGQCAAVFGQGMVGNFAAQLLQLAGARRVFAIDPVPQRLKTAKECGLRFPLDGRDGDLKQRLNELTDGQGCDIVVEATGVPQVAVSALKVVNPMGTVVLLGSPRGSAAIELYWDLHRTGVSIVGAHGRWASQMAYRNAPDLGAMCLEFLADGRLQAAPLITHTLPASQAQDAYVGLKDKPAEYLGVLLDLQQW